MKQGTATRRRKIAIFVAVTIALLLLASAAVVFWQQNARVKWTFPAGYQWGMVAVADNGTVYACSATGTVYAISAQGDEIWHCDVGFEIGSGPVLDPHGNLYVMAQTKLCSISPDGEIRWYCTVENEGRTGYITATQDALYVGCIFCTVHAISLDGKLLWTYEEEASFRNYPTVQDGCIYIGCEDIFGGSNNYLYCFDIDGAVLWRQEIEEGVLTSAVVGPDGTIYVGTGKGLKAFDSDGHQLWTALSDKKLNGELVQGKDGVLFWTSTGAGVYAINPEGSVRWLQRLHRKSDWNVASRCRPVVDENGIFYLALGAVKRSSVFDTFLMFFGVPANAGIPGRIAALEPDEGRILWEFSAPDALESTPAVGPDGTVYVTSWDGMLYALEP